MVPLLYWYKYDGELHRRLEMSIVFALLFVSLLFFQALVVNGEYRGSLIGGVADNLAVYIGGFGLWILWIMMATVTIVLVMEQSLSELAQPIKEYMDKPLTTSKPIVTAPHKETVIAQEAIYAPQSLNNVQVQAAPLSDPQPNPLESDISIPTPSIAMEVHEISPEPVLSEPQDISPESLPKESTILSLAKKVKDAKQHTVIVEELEENKILLEQIDKGISEKPKNFKLPPADFFQNPPKKQTLVDEAELDDKIRDLIEKLKHFNIEGDVVRTYAGPVVSTFEFKPAANIKVSKILGLQDDLAMALKAQTIRIQAPIPGKDVVGIEIPNKAVETIYLREMLESKLFQEAASPLTLILGKDIVGKPFITDLKKLPHLLIAGTTGSGKSVGINSMILSLLYKNSPDQLKLLMIDPKMLEFSIYNDIPHLLTPVITKPKEAISALNNMVYEMERRYQLMSETRTKNIENFNEKAKAEKHELLPYIVVIIDELADLMMTSGKDVEYSIARLAQMARASGIHLIVATEKRFCTHTVENDFTVDFLSHFITDT